MGSASALVGLLQASTNISARSVVASSCLLWKKDGSNCPAKYVSWPLRGAQLQQQQQQQQQHPHHYHSISAAALQHQGGSHSNCHIQLSYSPYHNTFLIRDLF
jgi:hypothetical protein